MGANAAAIALHHAVHDLFEQDEGSLPEVQMDGVSPEEAQAMFDALLRIAAPLRSDQTVWDDERDEDLPIGEYAQPGRLAAEGRLSTMHCVLRGLEWRGRELPDLGVSIWPGTLALDYRPGPQWSPVVVSRFVELLDTLMDLSEQAQLVVADELSNPLSDEGQVRFWRAVDQYLDANG
jgi:hypothetical protein